MKVEALTGAAIADAIPALARLRITVFVEWPYLYEGDLEYEGEYLRAFAAAEDAVLVIARDSEQIVGASTASPLSAQEAEIREPVQAYGLDTSQAFYFGESVLIPQYRGQGLGHAFFDQRETHARSCGAKYAMFAAAIRPEGHPSQPAQYRPLDAFWRGRGYEQVTGLTCQLGWTDRGDSVETLKQLQFWMREL